MALVLSVSKQWIIFELPSLPLHFLRQEKPGSRGVLWEGFASGVAMPVGGGSLMEAAWRLVAAGRPALTCSPLAPTARRQISTGVPNAFRVKEPPPPKVVDRWTEKRALFGVYDNIGILGDFKAHPKDLIIGPVWLRGWKGNELQRCIRKKKMVGDRMFVDDYHNLNKRIKYLYKHFNRAGVIR